LVDDVEANGAGTLIDVWVEDFIDKADGRGVVRVGFWKFNVDFPDTAFVWT
jgi:hypothetical protein